MPTDPLSIPFLFSSIVFLFSDSCKGKANAESFEMPFRGLWNERFHQPLFSCNNLTASIQYYDDQPFSGDLSMQLDFVEGGVNTFLPVFNNVLYATRVQMDAERRTADNVPPVAISSVTPHPEEFFPQNNVAFIDPSDPSRIYTTQPASEQHRADTPQWNVSAEGLRNRRNR